DYEENICLCSGRFHERFRARELAAISRRTIAGGCHEPASADGLEHESECGVESDCSGNGLVVTHRLGRQNLCDLRDQRWGSGAAQKRTVLRRRPTDAVQRDASLDGLWVRLADGEESLGTTSP